MAILPLAQIFLDVDLSWLKSDSAGNMVQHRGKKGIALSFETLDNYVGLPPLGCLALGPNDGFVEVGLFVYHFYCLMELQLSILISFGHTK